MNAANLRNGLALASQRARIGGLALAASHNSKAYTRNARAAFLSKFEAQVDPDGILPLAERQRRATAARRLHFARLAYRSAVVRRQRRKGQGAGP